jgi:hypothetical protein
VQLERLLHGIDAPASLQCLEPALRSLQFWLPDVQAAGGLSPEGLEQWKGLTSRVLAGLLARGRDATWRKSHELMYRKSVRNLCEPDPYHAALVWVAGMGADSRPLSQVLARAWRHLLSAHPLLTENQRIALGRALRALYDARGPRPRLPLGSGYTDAELVQALATAERGADSTARDQLSLLQRLLTGELTQSEPHGGGGGGHGGGPMRGRPRLQDRVGLDDVIRDPGCPEEEMTPPRDYRAEARTTRSEGREFETEPQAAAPGDSGVTEVYASTAGDPTKSVRQRLDRLAKWGNARAIAADVAMRSQPLGHRWGLMTPAELAAFFTGIEELLAATTAGVDAKKKRHARQEQLLNRSLAVLLMTMLVRGIEPAEAVKIRLVVDAHPDPGTGSVASTGELLCVSEPGTRRANWHWEGTPDLSTGGEVRNTNLVRPATERLRLRLEPPFAAFYTTALEPHWRSVQAGGSIPLIRGPTGVPERVADWCSRLNRKHGTRLTAHRISHFLTWRAAAERGLDPVMVAVVRGRVDLSSATQCYYQSCDPGILANRLSGFWQSVLAEAQKEFRGPLPAWLGTRWPSAARDLESGGPGIGSRKVPTRTTVRRVVAHVRGRLKQAASTRGIAPWEHLRTYHNAYTLYTIHFHLWATGARAVRDPLPDLRFVDPSIGLVLLCDKSAADYYGTRLVWVGADYLKHLVYYRTHLEAVAERTLIHRPELHAAHRRTMDHWRGAGPPGVPKGGLESLFYELTDSGLEALTPEIATDARMPPQLALPPNCNRHFLRTYLCDLGCRSDLVDAQLGHWHHGTEPWGASSSLTPRGFAQVMRRYLGTLTRDLGFRPVPSVLAARARGKGNG